MTYIAQKDSLLVLFLFHHPYFYFFYTSVSFLLSEREGQRTTYRHTSQDEEKVEKKWKKIKEERDKEWGKRINNTDLLSNIREVTILKNESKERCKQTKNLLKQKMTFFLLSARKELDGDYF